MENVYLFLLTLKITQSKDLYLNVFIFVSTDPVKYVFAATAWLKFEITICKVTFYSCTLNPQSRLTKY